MAIHDQNEQYGSNDDTCVGNIESGPADAWQYLDVDEIGYCRKRNAIDEVTNRTTSNKGDGHGLKSRWPVVIVDCKVTEDDGDQCKYDDRCDGRHEDVALPETEYQAGVLDVREIDWSGDVH